MKIQLRGNRWCVAGLAGVLLLGVPVPPARAETGATTAPGVAAAQKKTLAVLPFFGGAAKEKELAEKMRFAVGQKLGRDGNFVRKDNVEVEQVISALQIPWTEMPEEEDLQKIFAAVGTDEVVLGQVMGRKLTLWRYAGGKQVKAVAGEIPPGVESPRLTVEKLLTELAGVEFKHIREVECDHSDAKAEALWKSGPNLVADAGFEEGPRAPEKKARQWQAILGPDRYAPPVLTAAEAKKLGTDRVAVVPRSVAGGEGGEGGKDAEGFCLMERMSANIAANNGLACESIWVPVEHGKKYRFSCQYRSTGPVVRIFIKGFAFKPDQFGDKNDPEAVRREFYRAQVLPRKANDGWELVEMDFTPSTVEGEKGQGVKIEWVKVDLYIYLQAGDAFFDDVAVKKIE